MTVTAARSERFLAAFFVPVVERGEEFQPGELPLHITLFPPIEEHYDVRTGSEIRTQLNSLAPFDVTVGERASFGSDNEDIPVQEMIYSPQLHRVHAGLVTALANLLHDPTYRQPFRPHITVETAAAQREIVPGIDVHIGGLSIVERSNHGWVVVDKIGLKGGHETATR